MDKKLRVLIVDDEELIRISLKSRLSQFSTIEIIGEAYNIKSATEAIAKLQPDVIFLDISFPGESGFDLLDKIDASTKIVFVTAFNEHAIRAFEVNACDYLLKPVNPERLAVTIKRLEEEMEPTRQAVERFSYDDQIFIKLNYKHYFLTVNLILTITAAGRYTKICTVDGRKGLINKTMKEWEDCLPVNYFARIHRSTIMNTKLVSKIEKHNTSSYRVYLTGHDKPLKVSRRFASKLRKRANHTSP
jgi:two-component system, LytTR family, response regulator